MSVCNTDVYSVNVHVSKVSILKYMIYTLMFCEFQCTMKSLLHSKHNTTYFISHSHNKSIIYYYLLIDGCTYR